MARTKHRPNDRLTDDMATGTNAELSPELAVVFAKMLSAGCPPDQAAAYCLPGLGMAESVEVAQRWLSDVQVQRAREAVDGGAFFDLPKERRYQLALDKNLSECAYFCWTNSFCDVVEKTDLEKMRQAREVLKMALGQGADPDDPMQAFARMAMAIAQNSAMASAEKRRPPTHSKPS